MKSMGPDTVEYLPIRGFESFSLKVHSIKDSDDASKDSSVDEDIEGNINALPPKLLLPESPTGEEYVGENMVDENVTELLKPLSKIVSKLYILISRTL